MNIIIAVLKEVVLQGNIEPMNTVKTTVETIWP